MSARASGAGAKSPSSVAVIRIVERFVMGFCFRYLRNGPRCRKSVLENSAAERKREKEKMNKGCYLVRLRSVNVMTPTTHKVMLPGSGIGPATRNPSLKP